MRKEECGKSLRLFCETYAPEQFTLAWSDDHLKAIARMEECILHGGLFALAMPRGSGKTTLSEMAAVWALAYGYRKFVMVIAATAGKAEEILDRIKGFIESSDLFAADFGRSATRSRSWRASPTAPRARPPKASRHASPGRRRRSCCRR